MSRSVISRVESGRLNAYKLMTSGVARELKQCGNVHVLVEFWPVHLLMVHGNGEVLAVRCRSGLKNRKPVQREWDRTTVGEVQDHVGTDESYINRIGAHAYLSNEKSPGRIARSAVEFKNSGG
jgi:hypothetical protein